MRNQEITTENKIRFKFYKKGEYKYLSHLDITRIIIRAIRRTGIKIKYSCGYNPRPKISFSHPTPLGIESEAEYSDVIVSENISGDDFAKVVNLQLIQIKPQMKIMQAKKIGIKSINLMNDISVCLYYFELDASGADENLTCKFTKDLKSKIRSEPHISSSVFDLVTNTDTKNIIFLKLFGYVKIFKSMDNEIFKFNYFLDFFGSLIKNYSMDIYYMRKDEMYVFRNGTLKTPMEVT